MPGTKLIILTRPRDSAPETLAEYRATGGYASYPPSAILDAVQQSNLRGRGGASFPTARKWRLAATQPAGEKHVIANGGEHEPGSHKDRFLLAKYPHTVLDGLLLCMAATGASTGWIYLIEDMHEQIAALEHAIAELAGSGVRANLRIHKAPTTYVAGEETAALNSIAGKPAKPSQKPPFPGEAGLFGRPTTVNNVETLAHVPWILRHGADAYRAIGRGSSQGTMLFTLPDSLRRPGVVEAPFGTTYRELLMTTGGGTRSGRDIVAVLPALSCAWLAAAHFDAPIDHDSLKALGTSPGCGGITILEQGEDPVARTLEIAEFFQKEQCGQCPPCRMETSQFVHVLKAVRAGKPGDALAACEKVAAFAHRKGFCSLIEMAAAPVLSAMRLFPREFAR